MFCEGVSKLIHVGNMDEGGITSYNSTFFVSRQIGLKPGGLNVIRRGGGITGILQC